jgi:ATP-binding cassette subfamily B protein
MPMTASSATRQRFLVPEVIQTSAMDCGPAALTALLGGFGISVSYGRLREACQTDVDGTAIETLEIAAGQLGLVAEQVMVPVDHLLLPEGDALPCILVVRNPDGLTHFVVVWRRHGPLLQVMDPGVGRRWLSCRRLLESVFVHTQAMPAADFLAWARTDAFCNPLARRLHDLGQRSAATQALIQEALAGSGWQAVARLDAATRLVEALARGGGVRRGREACQVLALFLDDKPIPEAFWSVRAAPTSDEVLFRGAVLIAVRGRAAELIRAEADAEPDTRDEPRPAQPAALSPELAAALAEPPPRPYRLFLQFLGKGSTLALPLLALGLTVVAAGSFQEAVLFQGLIGVRRDLNLGEQRLLGVGGLLIFAIMFLLIEFGVMSGLLRLGRRLEVAFRTAFLEKIPRLHDRYFSSRTLADMAGRGHSIVRLRGFPQVAGQWLRAAVALVTTAAALTWIDPAAAPVAILAVAVALALPLLVHSILAELDFRVRAHEGALSSIHLDALQGLTAVRAHGAEQAVQREHDSLLVEWAEASRRFLRWVVIVQGIEALVGFGLAGWLLLHHAGRLVDAGGLLLLAYWAMNLPDLGRDFAAAVAQYPLNRSILLRLVEPLGAPDEPTASPAVGQIADPVKHTGNGVAISFESVSVQASGHTILTDLSVHLEAGSHVAIVGASGAGKSTLVALLLGWYRPATGRIAIDGQPLDAARLEQLRNEMAWVDPAVQVWNRSLLRNLLYGAHPADAGELPPLGKVLDAADLLDVLQRLPEGLQTALGEGGGLLSGGEGQRVRFGRALARRRPRLVILDEPFRGLERGRRHDLLQRARRLWHDATMLCISHDVGDVADFDRILVIDAGRLVEDGAPAQLAQEAGSHYRKLLDAEDAVRVKLWSSSIWRRFRLASGSLIESCSPEQKRTLRNEENANGSLKEGLP